MTNLPRIAGRLSFLALGFALVGCGGGPPPQKLTPVEGKVTVRKTPLAKGSIQFIPDKSKGNTGLSSATGDIKDGVFTLSTLERSDQPPRPGAPAGAYIVAITAVEIVDSVTPPKALIDPKHGTEAGGFRVEVKGDGKQTFEFDVEPFKK